jgi:hypothetical protein
MADSQVPWGVEALDGAVSEPAWKTKPSWYIVSTEDKMIPPDAQRAMSKRAGSTVVEVNGSHQVSAGDAELFDTLAIPVHEGRRFEETDREDAPAVVNGLRPQGRAYLSLTKLCSGCMVGRLMGGGRTG